MRYRSSIHGYEKKHSYGRNKRTREWRGCSGVQPKGECGGGELCLPVQPSKVKVHATGGSSAVDLDTFHMVSSL